MHLQATDPTLHGKRGNVRYIGGWYPLLTLAVAGGQDCAASMGSAGDADMFLNLQITCPAVQQETQNAYSHVKAVSIMLLWHQEQ